ncbi:hypothetical protein ACFQ1E_14540 [Sphingomonas canadensis]|uniref:Flippase-like domain-containing protein n=1 Tax=Sphingomonas canadensis TaxID=1219257 RepID=A0ABW3H961_9SPHN|nr:hypothetical protein [Sphingomonas canadensis]MCW3837198.1 hypothetical protein [Sphingomonas canadensis]
MIQSPGTEIAQGPLAQAALPDPAAIAGLEPIERIRRRWPLILGGALTLLMIAALARELFGSGLGALQRAVPVHPLFWLAFAAYYFAPPAFDYLIFRRLWRIPFSGLAALNKKRISNEVLLGYSGEAYFYAWARQRTQMVAAPFGAIKDVTILSAIAGNAMTLAMILVAAPFSEELPREIGPGAVYASAALVVAMSVPFLVFARRVFSLPRRMLWWVFGMHMARILFVNICLVATWRFALPGVEIGTWLFLCAMRLLSSRLPLVPNKELLFASFAMLLLGQDAILSELTAVIAALTLLVHVVLMIGFSIRGLIKGRL